MKTIKKSLFAACLAALCFFQVHAQNTSTITSSEESAQSTDLQLINSSIGITAEESKEFLPVFMEYRKELTMLQKKNTLLFHLSSEDVTDDEAWLGLDKFLKFEKDKAHLKKKYANKFRMVLPPKKAARYFMLESKMDAITNYDLAEMYPALNSPNK